MHMLPYFALKALPSNTAYFTSSTRTVSFTHQSGYAPLNVTFLAIMCIFLFN